MAALDKMAATGKAKMSFFAIKVWVKCNSLKKSYRANMLSGPAYYLQHFKTWDNINKWSLIYVVYMFQIQLSAEVSLQDPLFKAGHK